jgi:glycine/D-amino acid oxidase-like deaminating enzyme
MAKKPHIVVAGAGAFGGWTALMLREHSARVTLVDPWGPGNSRASSGGETRIMRCSYGSDLNYTSLAARALTLWDKYERAWKQRFLHRTGVLWMAGDGSDVFERASIQRLREEGIRHQKLSAAQLLKRWPQINFSGISWGLFEPASGYLDARRSCQAVVEAFLAAGGDYRQAAVLPEDLDESPGRSIRLSDGSRLAADIYVFACGPWLGTLFPRAIGNLIQPTKQDVFFFGTPPGTSFTSESLPVWADQRGHFFYGIPGSDRRGFKIADDTRGPRFDPTNGRRTVSPQNLRSVRDYIAIRFPALKDAPLLETRVCQYEQTPDGQFIVDRHPRAGNIWIVGGGSGHGFKHGPAIGEMVAGLILKDQEPEAQWRLSRFQRARKKI